MKVQKPLRQKRWVRSERIIQMTVDLNVLDHLGMNLYSNIAAVLTEAVANAWDADAEAVDIRIDPNAAWIEIVDDGVGMTVADMNEKYLRVGYRRREEDMAHGKFTAKSRQVMGRKGLGKLSLFSIAKLIEVQSAKEGQAHGLRMSVDGIHESVEKKEPYYRPDPITRVDDSHSHQGHEDRAAGHPTAAVGARRYAALTKTPCAAFFRSSASCMTSRSRSTVSRSRPTIGAICRSLQFLWTFGDFEPDPSSIPRSCWSRNASRTVSMPWDEDWAVDGWIGTARACPSNWTTKTPEI